MKEYRDPPPLAFMLIILVFFVSVLLGGFVLLSVLLADLIW